jgi:hypothetical protein
MAGVLLDLMECPACSKSHNLYLDAANGAYRSSATYLFVCDLTNNAMEAQRFRAVQPVGQKQPGWIDCWPKQR